MIALWRWLERWLGAPTAALMVFVLGLLIVCLVNSVWHRFNAWYWRGEAVAAGRAAETAQANADSADSGARNASLTRRQSDIRVADIHATSEAAALRVEANDHDRPIDPADRSPFDADSLRELEAAHDRARAAADRLRGAR